MKIESTWIIRRGETVAIRVEKNYAALLVKRGLAHYANTAPESTMIVVPENTMMPRARGRIWQRGR